MSLFTGTLSTKLFRKTTIEEEINTNNNRDLRGFFLILWKVNNIMIKVLNITHTVSVQTLANTRMCIIVVESDTQYFNTFFRNENKL